MGWPAAVIGGLIASGASNTMGGITGLWEGSKNRKFNRQMINAQLDMQREFAKHGVTWDIEQRMAAGEKYGIHPLQMIPGARGAPSPGTSLIPARDKPLSKMFHESSRIGAQLMNMGQRAQIAKLQAETDLTIAKMINERKKGSGIPGQPEADEIAERGTVLNRDVSTISERDTFDGIASRILPEQAWKKGVRYIPGVGARTVYTLRRTEELAEAMEDAMVQNLELSEWEIQNFWRQWTNKRGAIMPNWTPQGSGKHKYYIWRRFKGGWYVEPVWNKMGRKGPTNLGPTHRNMMFKDPIGIPRSVK